MQLPWPIDMQWLVLVCRQSVLVLVGRGEWRVVSAVSRGVSQSQLLLYNMLQTHRVWTKFGVCLSS
jgi:hypothetical protein